MRTALQFCPALITDESLVTLHTEKLHHIAIKKNPADNNLSAYSEMLGKCHPLCCYTRFRLDRNW
jgi:hypothetical protein